MLIVMKKTATDEALQTVKQFLIDRDYDFHQSTGANRIILGVIGNTKALDPAQLKALPAVLEIFKIPDEID
ncbi:MAG: hypothetical protein E4G91_03965 [Candidatus Zixiibacteriota bacterium]|nr:MAG: hypothetical protein E4G91_03965 [candidate division Zixibacteria bacterium]